MKKETKQRLIFWLAILLVILWILWPRSLERLILKYHAAADFSTVEQFQVVWTPQNAVRDYAADAYPSWILEEEQSRQVLEILRNATVSCPTGSRSLVIGEEGNYNLAAWSFNLHITQRGEIQVWNNVYKLDGKSHAALWEILTESNPERSLFF